MSLTYILKQPNSSKPTLIVAHYNFGGRRLILSTRESIHPDDWNPLTRRARKSAFASGKLNDYLDKLESKVKEVHLGLKSEFRGVTPDSLRAELNRQIHTGGRKETLVEFFERVITEKSSNKGTIEVYNSALKLLKGYHGPKDFYDIGPEWFRKYQAYMEEYRDKKITEGYSPNYIAKNISIVREIMTLARKRGLHRNESYIDRDYRKPKEEVASIYLNTDELMSMYNVSLTPGKDRVRNRFLIGAFSGLRFSDSSKITMESVRDGLLFDRNKKTGTNVVIPVHRVIREIMDRHPDGLPPAISNQKANQMLKEIGRQAGITQPIIINKVQGGVVRTSTVQKCDLISTHTARRSAATNMFLAGIPSISIMKITGHKTEGAFMKYIRMSSEENAISLKDHPYFT